jgi:hypothetical protein
VPVQSVSPVVKSSAIPTLAPQSGVFIRVLVFEPSLAFGERRSELAILGGEGADPAVKSRDGFGGRTGDSFGHDDTSDKYE